jgi:predicted hydrocarbon binding protein
MPFRVIRFSDNVTSIPDAKVREELTHTAAEFNTAKTPLQKARCVKALMDVMDQDVDAKKRIAIMEACGRSCIGKSTLKKAQKLQQQAADFDELLTLLNENQIGGGHLRRQGSVILASYDRCYCGSVSHTKEAFSDTYCHCSCGWYRELFETILDITVEVELLGSIIQGDKQCTFRIIPGGR